MSGVAKRFDHAADGAVGDLLIGDLVAADEVLADDVQRVPEEAEVGRCASRRGRLRSGRCPGAGVWPTETGGDVGDAAGESSPLWPTARPTKKTSRRSSTAASDVAARGDGGGGWTGGVGCTGGKP